MTSPVDDIIAASIGGDLPRVIELLKLDPTLAGTANMFGSTAIHAAHYSGQQEIVKLLNAGAKSGVKLRTSILGPG